MILKRWVIKAGDKVRNVTPGGLKVEVNKQSDNIMTQTSVENMFVL